MKIVIDIPDYDGNAIDVIWETGAKYSIAADENSIVLKANQQALLSFAKQMIYFAKNNNMVDGAHIHYDAFFTGCNTLEKELIIEKMEGNTGDGSVSE